MTEKIIRATIKREPLEGRDVNHIEFIELAMVDKDDEDYEYHISTIHVDEIEISTEFVKYLYEGICKRERESENKDIKSEIK